LPDRRRAQFTEDAAMKSDYYEADVRIHRVPALTAAQTETGSILERRPPVSENPGIGMRYVNHPGNRGGRSVPPAFLI
jgi:hypothetical protein